MFPSYRNQSVHLQIKSTDWFLYGGNIVKRSISFSWKSIFLDSESLNLMEKIIEQIKKPMKFVNVETGELEV